MRNLERILVGVVAGILLYNGYLQFTSNNNVAALLLFAIGLAIIYLATQGR